MLTLIQFFLAVFAIVGALVFGDMWKLIVPLVCLIAMFIIGQIDKGKSDKKSTRLRFLNAEIEKVWQKDSMVDSLLSPKKEMLLIDAVQFVFKDLGFKVTPPVHYHSVDRTVKIPNTHIVFGIQVMMCEGDLEENHPKISRALEFDKEKKEGEKSLLIASMNTHLPIAERSKINHISRELSNFLSRHNMSFITTDQLYDVWIKAKAGEVDALEYFKNVYASPE